MKIERFTRVNYFDGQLLGASDFADEQDYFRGKMRLQNRAHYGAGVVEGLEVEADGDGLRVMPGLAYDCLGRELIVDEPIRVESGDGREGPYVLLEFAEHPHAPLPAPGGGEPQPSRITEGARAYLGESTLPSTHRRTRRGWRACNRCESLPIALIRRGKPRRLR